MKISDEDKHDVPSFEITKTSTAVTFHLRPKAKATGENGPDRVFGWALATVNNDTGELSIQSDWGTWAYRWNIGSLGGVGDSGERANLMQFIADRDPGHCDYLANKLSSERQEREVFDPVDSVRALRAKLIENRLEQGRAIIEYYDDYDEWDETNPRPDYTKVWGDWNERGNHAADTREVWCHGHQEKWALTKVAARGLYDELDDLTDIDNEPEFCQAYLSIPGVEWISTEPYEGYLKHRPARAYQILEHGILPAVVDAAFAHAYPGRHRCEKRMGRNDGAGHWRDFHRGHNCQLDPTPIATPAPAAEAQHG